MTPASWLVDQIPFFLTQIFPPIRLLYASLKYLFMMERDCQMPREMSINPRSSTITVADGIVNDLLSSVNTQFREFVPREQSSAVNYVRGERAASPVARNPFRHEAEENRAPHRLMSPAAFGAFGHQSSPTEFSLHSTTAREEVVIDYELSKV